MIRGVILDRDGVLNRDCPGFITDPNAFLPIPGALEAVARLNRAGVPVAIATNQSGVGRGLMTAEALQAIHHRLRTLAEEVGAHFDAIYHCPHAPWDRCECRKPAPGMLLRAQKDLDLDMGASWFVGDKDTDIQCATAAGCRGVLVLSGLDTGYYPGESASTPYLVCADLAGAVELFFAEAR